MKNDNGINLIRGIFKFIYFMSSKIIKNKEETLVKEENTPVESIPVNVLFMLRVSYSYCGAVPAF